MTGVQPGAASHQQVTHLEVNARCADVGAQRHRRLEPNGLALASGALLGHHDVHTVGNRRAGEDAYGTRGADRAARVPLARQRFSQHRESAEREVGRPHTVTVHGRGAKWRLRPRRLQRVSQRAPGCRFGADQFLGKRRDGGQHLGACALNRVPGRGRVSSICRHRVRPAR